MSFDRVERHALYLQVAQQLRTAILRGELAPGMALPAERDMTRTFGVSRATIREAVRALEAQGLVASGNGGTPRTVASQPISSSMRESLLQLLALHEVALPDLVELRLTIEAAALRRAAEHPDPAFLVLARKELAIMEDAQTDIVLYQAADIRFHAAIVGASGNRAMYHVMLSLREVLGRFMAATQQAVSDLQTRLPVTTTEHRAILEAVESGDGDAAVEQGRHHVVAWVGDVPREVGSW